MPKKAAKSKTPVDDALEEKQKLAEKRKADDIQLVQTWQNNPTPQNLRPLMQRFEPVFQNKVTQWKAPNVNTSAFRADMKLQAVKAFRSYKPEKGAAPQTHLENYLHKSKRFNAKMQNKARMAEERGYMIGPIQKAQDELREEYGRDATPDEITEFLNPMLSNRKQLTPKKVQEIQAAQIRDVRGSSFESDPVPRAVGQEQQVIGLLRPALKPDRQEVFDYLYGLNGKPLVRSTSELAKKLGKSPSQISRMRTDIYKTFQRYNQ